MKNNELTILEHMHDYCLRVEESIARFGNSQETFLADFDFRNSVSMSIFQIGELANHLSEQYRDSTRHKISWQQVKGMRNLFAHDYLKMDELKIWNTARLDVPLLQTFCDAEIKRLKTKADREHDR